METLEREEQRQFGHVQIAINRWSSQQDKKAAASGSQKKSRGQPRGKPPVDPKSKLSRFRSNFQSSSSSEAPAAKGAQRQSVTPPPCSGPGLEEGKAMVRALSDHSAPSSGLPNRPASDGQRERPVVGLDPPTPANRDAFPGSTTQRSRPTSDTAKTRAGNNPASTAGGNGGGSTSAHRTVPGIGKRGSRVAARDLAKLPGYQASSDDSKKQAWDS